MSLSKFDPTPTSGPSSKVSFDGQNPLSEKQHPLLLPTVLDTVFPYLTFKELKNSRLVCKTWSEVAVPLIGRKKLEPVKFSSISFEDFFTLKKELIKFPRKVKLFQGFELTWYEMSALVWSNFLESFKPNQLVISGGSDPSNNLGNLLTPVLTSLNRLSLAFDADSASASTLLNNLAQLHPNLKRLDLKLVSGEDISLTHKQVHDIFRALEVVFQSQSSTLEELELEFKSFVSKPEINDYSDEIDEFEFEKIQLPVFPRLKHLNLDMEMAKKVGDYLPIFVPFDFCAIFPLLVQFHTRDSTLSTMRNDTIALTRGHGSLKKLNISGALRLDLDDALSITSNFQSIYSSFPYIEEFIFCFKNAPNSLYLEQGGIEIPWVDSLKTLDVFGWPQKFNFQHLKKLEYLHYVSFGESGVIDNAYGHLEFPLSIIEMLLDHHRQLPHLKRFHLTYEDKDYITPESLNQILEGLPAEFRAILTIDAIE